MTRIFLFYSIILLSACSTSRKVLPYSDPEIRKVDYSQLKYWASHPDKRSFSDYIPKDQQPGKEKLPVDIFFVYPTTLTAASALEWNADLEDEEINLKTDKSSIQFQASIFNTVGKIYAPRYRQAHYRSYISADKESSRKALDLAYEDVRNAFEYYLKHWNNGRPFIIASHSQGTTHTKRLLKDYIDGKPLQKKLIAAYLVGIPVLKNEYRTIKLCENPDETGCFCTWRTFKDGYKTKWDKNPEDIAVSNPVSWTLGLAKTTLDMHKGAVLTDFNKTVRKAHTAQIANGVLWTNKPKFFGSFLYGGDNFHVGDFNIFYIDVRDNARLRASEFLDKEPKQ